LRASEGEEGDCVEALPREEREADVFVVMLAYIIHREFERAWRNLNVNVKEGLVHLKTLCVLNLKLPGGRAVRRLPEPTAICSKLLDALGVTLPDTVATSSAHVRTYKNLKKKVRPTRGNVPDMS